MAIDHIPYPDANNLVHATEKGFYPVKIPVAHWQLRHYISTPEPDLLYFASRHEIYCLNTATKKRRHVATLPFEARCTASGFGYVCVGGEESGHFAAIKLDGRAGAEADMAVPLGARERERANVSDGRKASSVKVERIGEEIVNSISIHRLTDDSIHLDDIVAVLTNNDRTVRTYSLPSGIETGVLDLPSPMNHASISPDGKMLVAVGDVNMAYFFTRTLDVEPPQIFKPHNRLTSLDMNWKLCRVVRLHGSKVGGTICYFTTAWSPSGSLVAVGSEGGYITVFDTQLLRESSAKTKPTYQDIDDGDAVVAVVPGSRPDLANPHPGAIRSMIFSPEPWDLLIWAEDQGRVCVGDLRTGLKSRQVINLEPKEEGLRKITYEDVPSGDDVMNMGLPPDQPRDVDDLDEDFIRRYSHQDDETSVNFATEYIEARRRQRQLADAESSTRARQMQMRDAESSTRTRLQAMEEDDPTGLTAQEQRTLDRLRTTRQRHEAILAAAATSLTPTNYTTPDMFRSTAARDTLGDASSRPLSAAISAAPDSFPELARTNRAPSPGPRPGSSHGGDSPRWAPSLQDIARGGSSSNTWAPPMSNSLIRLSDGSRLPRRRASVVLSPPTTNPPSAGPSSSTGRGPSSTTEADDNPWQTIEEHMQLARGPLFASRLQHESAATRNLIGTDPNPPLTALQAEALLADRARNRAMARQRDRPRTARDSPPPPITVPPPLSIPGTAGATLGPSPAAAERFFAERNETILRRAQIQQFQMRGWTAVREMGVRTAGLAVSADGRTLWAACEEGIFEVEVGVKRRLFFPAMEPR